MKKRCKVTEWCNAAALGLACFGLTVPATAATREPRSASLSVPQGFSGAVVVASGERVLLSSGFGSAGGQKVTSESRFWIASVGKQFAAAAVMKLLEQGKLTLDDPLVRFFPEAPADKARVTIRQLLSHTSGIGQSYVSEMQLDRATAAARMFVEPLAGTPGSGFRYSNSNIQLAAAIVELVTGKPYHEFVQQELWGPAGMRETGFAGSPGAGAVLPIGRELPPRLQHSYWGEQGVYSSAGDLLRWYRVLAGGRVLKRSTVALMAEPQVKIGEGHAALGWFRGTTPKGTDFLFLRGNEDFGANALIYAYPNSAMVIIVLTHAGQASEDQSWSRAVLSSLQTQLGL